MNMNDCYNEKLMAGDEEYQEQPQEHRANVCIYTFCSGTSSYVAVYEDGECIGSLTEKFESSEPYALLLVSIFNGLTFLEKPASIRLYAPAHWISETINNGLVKGIRYPDAWAEILSELEDSQHVIEAVHVEQLTAKLQVGFTVAFPKQPRAKDEVWKPVPDTGGMYEVSDQGRVFSHHTKGRMAKEGILKPSFRSKGIKNDGSQRGYYYVTLYTPTHPGGKPYKVDHVVLKAFRGPRTAGLESCHWDDDPENNHLGNLRWDTRKNNRHDARFTGANAARVHRLDPAMNQLSWCPVNERIEALSG